MVHVRNTEYKFVLENKISSLLRISDFFLFRHRTLCIVINVSLLPEFCNDLGSVLFFHYYLIGFGHMLYICSYFLHNHRSTVGASFPRSGLQVLLLWPKHADSNFPGLGSRLFPLTFGSIFMHRIYFSMSLYALT